MIDHGVEIGLERANALGVRRVAREHVQEVRGMTEIASRGDRLAPRRSRQNAATIVGTSRDDRRPRSSDVIEIVPAAMRSASIGSTSARAHSRSSARSPAAAPRRAASSARNASSWLVDGRSPCQSSHVVSSNVARCGQLVDRIAGDHELAAFAVDVTEPRRRGDDAFETAVAP